MLELCGSYLDRDPSIPYALELHGEVSLILNSWLSFLLPSMGRTHARLKTLGATLEHITKESRRGVWQFDGLEARLPFETLLFASLNNLLNSVTSHRHCPLPVLIWTCKVSSFLRSY